ncbi:ribosome silencing factor [Endozoicomonas lisbonensis]|uniref:Ribosomal silencing factor RsfS n=1 Tax=Endozoicomonas lisbonensis TaxID=3120522 RepID=A0ABV2SJS1_9GAMM
MQSDQLKQLVIEAIEEMKGNDLTCLDVSEMTDVTDYMIIACGTSNRHVKSVADNVVQKCKDNGVRPLGMEGEDKAEWVLVDLGDVVAHIMLPATRAFYDLERLWETGRVEQTAEAAEA